MLCEALRQRQYYLPILTKGYLLTDISLRSDQRVILKKTLRSRNLRFRHMCAASWAFHSCVSQSSLDQQFDRKGTFCSFSIEFNNTSGSEYL